MILVWLKYYIEVDFLQNLVFNILEALSQVVDRLVCGDRVVLNSSLDRIQGSDFRLTTEAVLPVRNHDRTVNS